MDDDDRRRRVGLTRASVDGMDELSWQTGGAPAVVLGCILVGGCAAVCPESSDGQVCAADPALPGSDVVVELDRRYAGDDGVLRRSIADGVGVSSKFAAVLTGPDGKVKAVARDA